MPEVHSVCPKYHRAVELIGRRWTGAIILLLLGGHNRFHELAERIPGMSDRMLSERLKELEGAGIVERVVIPDTPVRIEYRLTEMGLALEEPLDAISDWATHWLSSGDTPRHQDQEEGRSPAGDRVSHTAF